MPLAREPTSPHKARGPATQHLPRGPGEHARERLCRVWRAQPACTVHASWGRGREGLARGVWQNGR